MKILEKIKGVIIKTQDYGETHKIITIFSKKIGKFAAIARGANKPNSRMSAITQPFIYGEFLVYVSPGLSTIQQGEVINSFRGIREDIIKTAYVAYISELTDKLLTDKQPEYVLYDQFIQTLEYLTENKPTEVPVMMYELKVYQRSGFAPVVDQCVRCGSQEELVNFSIQEGGLLCPECRTLDSQAVTLPETIAKMLTIFLQVGLEQVGTISIKRENEELLRKLLNQYYDQYGSYYLKSRRFLDQLDLLR